MNMVFLVFTSLATVYPPEVPFGPDDYDWPLGQ
jgi:hypothetical protein